MAGLQRGGKLEEEIWKKFAGNPSQLHKIAQAIVKGINHSLEITVSSDIEEEEFPEGKILFRLHKYHERNSQLVIKAKEKAMRNGTVSCQVCGFDFYKTYGELWKDT
ncbi:hypothetical protein JCM39194_20100 [Desulfotomaculum varum]